MKNQLIKRFKGIIALALCLFMISETSLTARAEGTNYTYKCELYSCFESGNAETACFIRHNIYDDNSAKAFVYTGGGNQEKEVFESSIDTENVKVLEGGATLSLEAETQQPWGHYKYAKFIVKNGSNSVDATYQDEGTEKTLIYIIYSDVTHTWSVPLGESGHCYIWTALDNGPVTKSDRFSSYTAYPSISGSGSETDPCVFGIELTEVYRIGGDLDVINAEYLRSEYVGEQDTYRNLFYARENDTITVSAADSEGIGHYEIRKYDYDDGVDNEENLDPYTVLSYSDICFKVEDTNRASFVMPEGHIQFKKRSHEEMFSDDNMVEAKAATCTKSGNIEYYKCPSCEKIYAKEGDTFVEKTLREVTIPAKGHNYKTVVEPATKNKAGVSYDQCVNCRDTKNKTTIYRPVVSLKKTAFTYNGKTQVPSVVVKDTKGKTISKSYYTVKYSNKNSKSIGTYKASVVLNTKYKGTIDLTYTIAPGKITLTKGDVTKNTIAVIWKKSSGATGYEVQYSTDKNFTKGKTKTATVKDKLTYKASKLTGNKTYYLRARSYTTVKNKKVYSDWSTTLKVKTSKK